MSLDILYSYPWVNPIGLTILALFVLWIRVFNPRDILGWRRAAQRMADGQAQAREEESPPAIAMSEYETAKQELMTLLANEPSPKGRDEWANELLEAMQLYSLWKFLEKNDLSGLRELAQMSPLLPRTKQALSQRLSQLDVENDEPLFNEIVGILSKPLGGP